MDNCIACRSTVRPRQEGLLCEECNQWQHRTCTGISQAAYRRAVKGLEEIKWTCTPCTNAAVHALVREITPDVSMEEEMPPTMDMDTSSASAFVGLPDDEPQESFTAERSYVLPEPILEDSIEEDAPVFDAPADEGPRYIILEEGSERGNKKLLDREGYSYIFRKESTNGNVNWRCVHRPKVDYCRATIIQSGDDFRPGLKNHNHPAKPGQHIAAQINTQVRKNSAKDVFTTSSAKVVEEVMLDLASETAPFHSRPKMATMIRTVNRLRQKSRPDDPTDLRSEIDTEFMEENMGNFLRKDIQNGTSRHIILATDTQLQLLRKTKVLFVDGTFRVVKKPFTQLFSLHGFISKSSLAKQVPLVYCLMSNRSKEDYCQVFEAITEMCPTLAVQEFVADFEIATWQALRDTFPGISIKGCVFHWSQAVFRKIQENGLQVAYNSRGDAYNFLRQLMALPFLPEEKIAGAFYDLFDKTEDEKVISVLDYVERQWISNRVFKAKSWSVFMRTIRTNNDVEGWHNRINSRLNTRGPVPFYLLLAELYKEAQKLKMDMVMLTEGKISRCQRSRVDRMQTRIFSLWTRHNAGELGTAGLLRECAFLYGPSAETS